ncbi:nucleotidyltransferase domain-containing protein [Xylanibacillus composti]|uniref:Nucleotidyltransferase n=1 Tax=Xylanibacillus composti TaxID=1572762 RepID=A0A8J4H7H2_9BACL|nr:nucleotidyltransferase domain-containing protein [Xylanibacillus composti]MDT9726467.1 nucleotidyltransferase domain-containing protein [Xylanibacillus composti]GIQ69963.1 hypothetical protein XYCOK13_27870 [Xylanibacillus composti]
MHDSEKNSAMPAAMDREIRRRMQGIEHEEQVRVLYACESGSRSWGWASADSDYDVRFIYVHPRDEYITLFPKRDVIERAMVSIEAQADCSGRMAPLPTDPPRLGGTSLDIHGWDLRKALVLLHKSNPQLIEWLYSPIVYLEQAWAVEQIRELAPSLFSPKAGAHHYARMARSNYNKVLQAPTMRIKTCLHALRSALAGLWIVRHQEPPPVRMDELMNGLDASDSRISEAIQALLTGKRAGVDDEVKPNMAVLRFLEDSIAQVEQAASGVECRSAHVKGDERQLDELFRAMLHEMWK